MAIRRAPYRSAKAFTLVELLVVIAIVGVLLGLTLVAAQRVRATRTRLACANNLRQIGLGLGNYHSARSALPPGMSLQSQTKEPYPHLSWHARILPYIEQEALWLQTVDAYRVQSNFTSSPPHPFATPVPIFGCPADSRTLEPGMARGKLRAAFTSYLGVSGTRTARRNGVLFRNSAVRLEDISDGTSNTLMVGERPPSADLWEGWWYAGYGCDGTGRADMVLGVQEGSGGCIWSLTNCPRKAVGFAPGRIENNCDSLHFWSLHVGGANFLFCDGSVRFLSYSADPIMPALATRAGGEVVSVPD